MKRLAVAALILAIVAPTAVAQMPLIDAGNQAMIMHNGNLLQQQTAPNNEDDGKRGLKAEPPKLTLERRKHQMRIEYNARVARDGKTSADAWLTREAGALGREYAKGLQR